jgi:hypothetical protein
LAFTCQGVRIGIRVNTAQALEQVWSVLPPGWKPAPKRIVDDLCSVLVAGTKPGSSLRRYSLFYWGASLIERSLIVAEVLAKLESTLHLIVALGARRRRFVRAAVAGWRGQAVLLLGPPASGKSTLLAALLRAGATYYSDRYAVLDGRGRVHPYPTPLPLHVQAGWRRDERHRPAPARNSALKPLPVGLIVDTHYQAGTRSRLRRLSPGEALCTLLRQTVDTRMRPHQALAILHGVAATTNTLRGQRGEAEELAPALLRHLENQLRTGRNRPPGTRGRQSQTTL